MKKYEIERELNRIVSNNIPDVHDEMLIKCEKKGTKKMKKENIKKEKNSFFTPKLAPVFGVIFGLLLGVIGLNYYEDTKIDTIVELDVNPSIELKVNRKEEIINAIALNEDGKKVIEDMDLEDVDLNVGVNAIIGSMVTNGYVSEIQNSILISVKNDNEEKAVKLQEKLIDEVEQLINGRNIEGSILTQIYDEDDAIEALAKKYNISEGKATLISKVIASELKDSKGTIYTFEDLVPLNINEIKLLLESKEVKVENITSKGTSSDKSLIGKENAKNIALKSAGLTSITHYEIELDTEKGVLVYEVEFKANGKEYDFDINAKTGEIVKSDIEVDDDIYDVDDKYDDDNNDDWDDLYDDDADDDWDDLYDDDDDDDDDNDRYDD